ncbi:Ni/Fe hydrogenase subunit alpha [Nanoarchaeota archaeon]
MGTISINHLTKIEGTASLTLKIEKGQVQKCELRAVEGSRYFEGLLVGKQYNEASWISSRICGICSCAHTVTAVKAIEQALGIKVTDQTKKLRQLYTIGERIRSHATHLYFLALPDYLGFESGLEMAPKKKNEVMRALKIMKIGNDIIKLAQGREMHPISTTPGGFLKYPKQKELDEIRKRLEDAVPDAEETLKLFCSLKYPKYEFDTQFFSLTSNDEYALLEGDILAGGKVFKEKDYRNYIKEHHDPDNTANFVVKEGKSYMVGALARINNNKNFLSARTKQLLHKADIEFPSKNPFYNNIAQAAELLHYFEHAIKLLEKLQVQPEKPVEYELRAGQGVAAVEVPRGTLWHEYELDDKGQITYANIVTPTAQNLRNMQEDIKNYIPNLLNENKQELILDIEMLIRAYDPCFSCASHFLKVKFE